MVFYKYSNKYCKPLTITAQYNLSNKRVYTTGITKYTIPTKK